MPRLSKSAALVRQGETREMMQPILAVHHARCLSETPRDKYNGNVLCIYALFSSVADADGRLTSKGTCIVNYFGDGGCHLYIGEDMMHSRTADANTWAGTAAMLKELCG